MTRLLILLVCLFSGTCSSVRAQAVEETPEAIAKLYIAASTSGDWTKAASYLDPAALSAFKRMFSEVMLLDKKDEAGKQLFGLKNNAEFEQLSDEQVFTRLMTLLTSFVPQMKQMLSQAQNTVLGQVAEGSDVVHIVYRMTMSVEGTPISKIDVMSLKKIGAGWRLQLSGEMEGAITAMAKSLAEKAQSEERAPKPAPAAKRPVRKR